MEINKEKPALNGTCG